MHPRTLFGIVVALLQCNIQAAFAQEKILSWDAEVISKSSSPIIRLRKGADGEVLASVNTETIRRLVEITNRIAGAANQTAHLYILSGTQPNASASKKDGSPKIAINIAMINLLGNDYDAYASVIGHEIAHLVRDHGAGRQTREGARSVISNILGAVLGHYGVPLGGTIASVGTTAVSRTFSRDEEREADSLGIGYMVQAGYDPMGGVRAWERMTTAARSNPLPFLSTHPAPDERVETMRNLAQRYPAPSTVAAPIAQTATPVQPPTPTTVAVLPDQNTGQSPAGEAAAIELALWETVKDTRNADELKAYIAQYPQGRFDGVARERLRGLETPAQVAAAAPAGQTLTPTQVQNDLQRMAAGTVFRDCPDCPEMAVIPPGNFMMGGTRSISLPRAYAVGKFEVTFDQWDACVAAAGCIEKPSDEGWGRGTRPVMNVSWDDAKHYTAWLTRKVGKSYRLLTEVEWEYAARAGTTTAYYWGDQYADLCQYANADVMRARCSGISRRTVPVGERKPNAFGLHDMLGNVSEWTENCWIDNIDNVTSDGSARIGGECERRVLRGGSWDDGELFLRAESRGRGPTGLRNHYVGFRVARSQ